MDECKACKGGGCTCGGGMMGGMSWMSNDEHRIVRGIMMFFLLLFVFFIGLALGELKAFLRQQDGYGDYMGRGMRGVMHQTTWEADYPTAMPSATPTPGKK